MRALRSICVSLILHLHLAKVGRGFMMALWDTSTPKIDPNYHSRSLRAMTMSSTDRSVRQPKKTIAYEAALKDRGAPAVILVRPYLDENVGSCARAMLNFGLTDLRIIDPFCDHLTPMARARASGADNVLEGARVFRGLDEAVADLSEVIGTSARQRDMTITIVSPEEAARLAVGTLANFARGGARAGYMFGSERNGLTNEDLVYADRILQIPTNPAFSSLNLGQAVQICG
ncbi:trna rrna methyltransferase [Nannochloropsis gaditana]|uniref:Trna rrna methyltransferase n=1 Tax=Nannochloropsis gaditana TaxID=72520 RepID=W7TSC2_9STRA|nr:trna rrna methyltransferase [Nannochloropsis gaditana]